MEADIDLLIYSQAVFRYVVRAYVRTYDTYYSPMVRADKK